MASTPHSESNTPHPDLEGSKLYRLLIQNLPKVSVVVFDHDLRCIAAEGAFPVLQGLSNEHMVGRTIWEILSPESCEVLVPHYRAALAGDKVSFDREFNNWAYHADILPVRNAHDEIIAGMVVTQDINEQKRMEAALRESEALYRHLFDNSMDGILLTEPDGTILRANAAACQLYERTEEEIQQAGRAGLVDLTDSRLKPALEERRRTGKVRTELRQRRRDGTVFPTEITTQIFQGSDGRLKTSMIVRDITERKVVEDALQEAQQFLEQTAAAMPSILYIYDLTTQTIIYSNGRLFSVLGYSSQDIRSTGGQQLFTLIHPADRDRLAESNLRLASTPDGEIVEVECRVRHANGSYRWMRNRAVVFKRLPDGSIWQILSVLQDISIHKEAEKQAIELGIERERTRLLSNFITDISHDFRTRLSIISSSLYMLGKLTDSAQRSQHEKKIAGQVEGLNSVLTDMLTMTRLDNSLLEDYNSIDINQVIKDVASQFSFDAERSHLHLILNMTNNLPHVAGDEYELSVALSNIIENAIRYTPAQGSIIISAAERGAFIAVEIQDTGVGISPIDLPHIFERLYRGDKARSLDTGAAGLGLPIAHKIVERHGGKIEVESMEGKGSTFRLYLPAQARANISRKEQ